MIEFFSGVSGSAADLLVRTVPVMVLGVLFAEFLVALDITDRIASLTRPLTRFSHLSDECGSSFMMAFVSPSAANAMLADYYHKGVVSRRELVIASLINSFPTIVMHWRTLLPVYLPLLGFAGGIYFLILTFVGFCKTFIVMIAGRIILRDGGGGSVAAQKIHKTVSKADIPRVVWQSARKPLKRILLITIPTIIIVALLMEAGVFDAIGTSLEGVGRYFPVPVEGISIIAAQFASYVAAASVASPLYYGGAISTRDLVLTLMVGNVLSSIVRSLRWFGPGYVAIFGPRIGGEILFISTALRNGIMIALIFLVAWLW